MSHRVIATARTAAVAVAHTVAYALLWLILWVIVPAFVLQWSPAVLTGDSMQPGLDAGDVVLAAPHSGVGLEPGVVVLFEDPTTDGLTTHRIVGVEDDGSYRSKGDSNAAADSTLITSDSIRGVGRLAIPWIGLPRLWVQTGDFVPLGVLVAVMLSLYGRPVLMWVHRRRMAHAGESPAQEVPVVVAERDSATPDDGSWEGMRDLLRRNLRPRPLVGFSDRLTSSLGRPVGLAEAGVADGGTGDAPMAGQGRPRSVSRPRQLERPRMRPMQKAALILLVIATSLLVMTLAPVQMADAQFIGTTAPGGGSVTSDTLDPPTGVSVDTSTAGQVDLSWTPTVDTYATGYRIYRSETSGSGYALVDTVVGSATAAHSDVFTPTKRTYYYLIESYYASWTSVDSNEATADVGYDAIIKTTSGLVSYWRLGLTTTTSVAPDDWGSSDGTPSGGFKPQTAGAIVDDPDTSASFDGTSGDVNAGNHASLQLNSGSVETWMRTANAGTGYRELVSKEGVYALALRDNVLGVWDDGSKRWRSTGLTVNDSTWHHVVLTYQSGVTNGTKIYLDGSLVLTTTITVVDQSKPVHFGTYNDGTAEEYAGRLDEIAIYNTVLSATVVSQHDQAGIGADVGYDAIIKATSGLVSYWRLGLTTTTSVAPDDWGSSDGTPSGGFTPQTAGAIVDDPDTSASFDGTSGDVNAGNHASLQLNSGSVETWMSTANAGKGYRELVSKEGVYYLALRDNVLGVWDDGSNSWKSTGLTVNDSTWHHVVLTYQSGVTNGTKIYLDGSLVLTTTTTVVDQSKPVHFGTYNGTAEEYAGRLDEIAIYNTVLSATVVSQHHQAGITP